MRKILILDNYDSFTYNLFHYVQKCAKEDDVIDVFRNDKISIEKIDAYDYIILSPGPGLPNEAGITKDVILKYSLSKKILGICLGHQAIGEVFGARLRNMDEVYHGLKTTIHLTENIDSIFKNIPTEFGGGRYHSWIVEKNNLPDCLKITAVDDNGFIMAMQHTQYNVRGIQFHPESILTDFGEQIISNWINA